MTMNKSAKQPFKELPIVRLRPEQRADQHPRYPRYGRRNEAFEFKMRWGGRA